LQSRANYPVIKMLRLAFLPLIFFAFLTYEQAQSQSLYMNDNAIGLSGGFGYASNTASLSATSYNFGYSLNRKVDFMIEYDRLTTPDFGGVQSDFTGSIVFYPKRKWEDDPFTLQVFTSGTNSTVPNRSGFSATLGTAISTEIKSSNITSFFPRAGFLFVPYRPGAPSQYSAITVDTSITFQLSSGVRLLISPGYFYEFGEHTSNFALTGRILI
jgi:hypothetical protein